MQKNHCKLWFGFVRSSFICSINKVDSRNLKLASSLFFCQREVTNWRVEEKIIFHFKLVKINYLVKKKKKSLVYVVFVLCFSSLPPCPRLANLWLKQTVQHGKKIYWCVSIDLYSVWFSVILYIIAVILHIWLHSY